MVTKRYPYWVWVVGACVVWAIVLLVLWRTLSSYKFHRVFIFFAGYMAGVLSASIARKVYK